MKKFLLCLLVVLSFFMVTGCNSHNGKKKMGNIYFAELKDVKKTDSDKGKLESGKKWNSVRYVLDGMAVSVVRYENQKIDVVIGNQSNIETRKIEDLEYKYREFELDSETIMSQYYIQKGDDTYYISATYKNTDANKKVFESFLESIEVD